MLSGNINHVEALTVNQELFTELVSQGLIQAVHVTEGLPSKGKALTSSSNKHVWTVTVVLINGSESLLLSTRGSPREWASLDRLTEWLKAIGLSNYQVNQMEIGV